MEPTNAMLQVPWGRTGKKKDVAHGTVQPPNPEARYHSRPILPKYAVVEVMWTHDHHDDDELDFANEEGDMTLGRALGTRVLWNKADIVLDMLNLASKSLSYRRLPRVAQVMTMTMAAAMATTMMAAPVALLHVARVPTRATDKEIQGVHLATKHRLQARTKGNVHQRRRSLQKKRGTNPPTSPQRNGRCST
jgi:hypothetical protein